MAESSSAIDATVLLVGQGVLAEALAKRVAREGIELERANVERAAQLARVAVPELVILAGDAAADGGKRVLAQMAGEADELPILVICGPVLATLGGVALRKSVAALAPEGGLDLCAQRIRTLVADLAEAGLGGRSLQQVVDGTGQPAKLEAGAAQPAVAPKAAPVQPQRAPARRGTLVGIAPPGAVAMNVPAAKQQPPKSAPSAESAPVETPRVEAPPEQKRPAVTESMAGSTTNDSQGAAVVPVAAADEFEALDDAAEPLPKMPPLLKSQPPPAVAREAEPAAPVKAALAPAPLPSIRLEAGADAAFARTLIAAPVPSIKPAVAPPRLSARAPEAAPAPAALAPTPSTSFVPALPPAPVPSRSPAQPPPLSRDRSLAPARAPAPAPTSLQPAPGTFPSAAELDVRVSEEPPAEAHTPVAWTTASREPALPEASAALDDAAFAAPRRFPVKLVAGAAVLVAAAAAPLLLRGAPETAPPATVTGSVGASAAPAAALPAEPAALPTAPSPATAAKTPPSPRAAAAAIEVPAPAAPAKEAADAQDDEDATGTAAAAHSPELRDKLARVNRLVEDGHRLLKLGHHGLAEAAYLKALAQLPDYPRAMAGLARVHIQRKDGVEAVRWAKRLVAAQPKRGNNQLLLGDAWALRGNMTLARAAWQTSSLYGNTAARKRLAATPNR